MHAVAESDKKGFDNLTNREQVGKAQKKEGEEEAENRNQEAPAAGGEPASCEHQDERERLERERQAEAEEKHDDGMMGRCRLNDEEQHLHLIPDKLNFIDLLRHSLSLHVCVFELACTREKHIAPTARPHTRLMSDRNLFFFRPPNGIPIPPPHT